MSISPSPSFLVTNGFAPQEVREAATRSEELLKNMRKAWDDRLTKLEGLLQQSAATGDDTAATVAAVKQLLGRDSDRLSSGVAAMQTQLAAAQTEIVRALEAGNGKQCQSILAELRKVQAQLATIVQLTLEGKKELARSVAVLRNTITNVNHRTFPTAFVLLDKEALLQLAKAGDGDRDGDGYEADNSQSLKHTATSIMSRATSLFGALSQPTRTVTDAMKAALRKEEHVALVCELCRRPQGLPDGCYTISRPIETVGKILPLARAGMQLVFLANTVSSVGRVFGLPTPVLSDQTLEVRKEDVFTFLLGPLPHYFMLHATSCCMLLHAVCLVPIYISHQALSTGRIGTVIRRLYCIFFLQQRYILSWVSCVALSRCPFPSHQYSSSSMFLSPPLSPHHARPGWTSSPVWAKTLPMASQNCRKKCRRRSAATSSLPALRKKTAVVLVMVVVVVVSRRRRAHCRRVRGSWVFASASSGVFCARWTHRMTGARFRHRCVQSIFLYDRGVLCIAFFLSSLFNQRSVYSLQCLKP
jgi:hypothetical protein